MRGRPSQADKWKGARVWASPKRSAPPNRPARLGTEAAPLRIGARARTKNWGGPGRAAVLQAGLLQWGQPRGAGNEELRPAEPSTRAGAIRLGRTSKVRPLDTWAELRHACRMVAASVAFYNPTELRQIAVAAGVDPRTVKKYLRGEHVVSTAEERIQLALNAFDENRRCPECGQLVLRRK